MEATAAVAASSTLSNQLLFSSASSLFSPALPFPCSPRRTAAAPPRTQARPTLRVSAVTPRQGTLSEGWALSGLTPAAFRMPSLEELDSTNMLLRQRIVFLGSLVDAMTADLIVGQLLFLDAEDQQKEIKLFINSPGGSVTAAMGIYDAMKLCKADVSTVCMGFAASMSAFLLAGGTKGKRFCMPNARVMIHTPLGSAQGSVLEMGLQIKETMYENLKMVKILSRITGKPEKQIELDTQRDFYMNPWEAKEYGLVDAVIDDGKPGLVAPLAEPTPPPKTIVWPLWDPNREIKRNLPSEEKLLENGNKVDSGSGEEEGKEQPKEEPTTV